MFLFFCSVVNIFSTTYELYNQYGNKNFGAGGGIIFIIIRDHFQQQVYDHC